MLQKHAGVAKAMGMSSANIYIGDIGDVVEINEAFLRNAGTVPAGRVLVDGLGVGDVGSIVLRDRKHLGEDGLIVAVCTISWLRASWLQARMWFQGALSMCGSLSRFWTRPRPWFRILSTNAPRGISMSGGTIKNKGLRTAFPDCCMTVPDAAP